MFATETVRFFNNVFSQWYQYLPQRWRLILVRKPGDFKFIHWHVTLMNFAYELNSAWRTKRSRRDARRLFQATTDRHARSMPWNAWVWMQRACALQKTTRIVAMTAYQLNKLQSLWMMNRTRQMQGKRYRFFMETRWRKYVLFVDLFPDHR